MQSMSAHLLFAQAASACGSELTRACLLEEASSVTEWTGGGLHVPQNPAENSPGECFALLRINADGFTIDEELTDANEGIFNCVARERHRRHDPVVPSSPAGALVDEFLRATITGLCTAGIFAIAASGLVLTYTTTGIFNFAHGAVGMLAAFSYWQLLEWGLPAGVSVVVVLLVLAPLFGIARRGRRHARPQRRARRPRRLVVSVALLAASLALAVWVWPPDEARPLDSFFEGNFVTIFGVRVSWHEALAFLIAIGVALGLRLLLRGTRAGITMRAVVDDRGLASLNGAHPDRSAMLAWSLGCSLAALAGILLAPLQQLAHLPLTLLIVNAYAAAMLGRLRNLPLTFLGAALLGLLDSYGFTYLPDDGSLEPYFRSFRPAIPVVVLFIVLIVLPSARLRTGAAKRRVSAPRPSWVSAGLLAAAIVAGGRRARRRPERRRCLAGGEGRRPRPRSPSRSSRSSAGRARCACAR